MVELIKKAGVLRGIREQRVDATQTLAEALQQLEYLRELWQASVGTNQLAHQEIPWTSEECYEFLGAVGFLWRSRLGRAWEVALQEAGKPTPQGTSWSLRARERHKLVSVPESPKLLSDFEETIHWSAAIYHRYGRLIAAYAVTVPEPDAWLAWAEQLRDASELAEPDLCPDDIECTVSDVVEALRQLDQAELVCALCQLEADKVPGCAAAEQLSPQSSATDLLCSLPSAVAALQEDLDECVAWLHENPETFLLASYYIQTVIAGLRPDLEDVYHLVETVWKFEPLVEMLGHAEGVSIPAGVSETLRCAIEQAVRQHRGAKSACAGEASSAPVTYIAAQTPTTRLSTSDTRRLATFEAFPREELTSLLAAASDQAHNPRFLRWRSPDRQYEAVLVIQPTHATLNFYRATGQHAEELIDTPICLAGVTMRIGPPGRVLFDPTQLAQGNQPVYLEVGPERQRWRPDPAGQTPEPASK